MNEKCSTQPQAKKSLMNALESLESKARGLFDLANFSDEVVSKFNNPRPTPEPEGESVSKVSDQRPIPDLIDLFNEVAERIELATNRIGNNTERIRSIIE